MTALTYFRTEFDWSTRRIFCHLDVEAGRAIQAGRNDFEPAAGTRIFNWVGQSNWLYRDYHGKNLANGAAIGSGKNESHATYMKASYPILFDFRENMIVLDLNGTPVRTYDRVRLRYDTGLYATLANGRDSWSADFKSFTTTWLASH